MRTRYVFACTPFPKTGNAKLVERRGRENEIENQSRLQATKATLLKPRLKNRLHKMYRKMSSLTLYLRLAPNVHIWFCNRANSLSAQSWVSLSRTQRAKTSSAWIRRKKQQLCFTIGWQLGWEKAIVKNFTPTDLTPALLWKVESFLFCKRRIAKAFLAVFFGRRNAWVWKRKKRDRLGRNCHTRELHSHVSEPGPPGETVQNSHGFLLLTRSRFSISCRKFPFWNCQEIR